jgi:hypothetical protein
LIRIIWILVLRIVVLVCPFVLCENNKFPII